MLSENYLKLHKLDDIVEILCKPEIKVVSFDLFDTLITRPLEDSTDIFELLDRDFSKASDAAVSFKSLRLGAEELLRRRIIRGEIDEEDITLTTVYETLKEEYSIDPELAEKLKTEETLLEVRLSNVRTSGKCLWDKAISLGKRVVVSSDMYLEKEILKLILEKNGYTGYEDIFVSSDIGKRKITGNLYLHVLDALDIRPDQMIHIGDNLKYDVEKPAELGIVSVWLPSAIYAYDLYGTGHQVEKICTNLTDWEAAKKSFGIGAMRQMAARVYFDDPFREFDENSDYNGDPYFVGYGALGMHLLSLTEWFADNIRRDGIKHVVFMARDGYLPMLCYDIYRKLHPDLPDYDYLHVSRRAVLPAMIHGVEDLYDLPVDIKYQTPEKLLKLLAFCDKEDGALGESDIGPEAVHFTKDSYQSFISDFIKNRYDKDKHEAARIKIRDYIIKSVSREPGEDVAVFDMGYSGRIPAAVASVTDWHPKVYYFHADSRSHFRYESRSGIKIRSFFDFNPYMEASIREYSYLEPVASCIGYTEELEEIYDDGPAPGYIEAAEKMQRGAIDFVRDYLEFFGEYEQVAMFRFHDGAMAFEAFIRYCRGKDLMIYDKVLIDDELWGGRRDIDLKYLIDKRRSKLPEYAKASNDLVDIKSESGNDDPDWNREINYTPLRESALNWYEFDKLGSVLEIAPGYGELTGLLKRRCGSVDCLGQDIYELPVDKKYDYVICMDGRRLGENPVESLNDWLNVLKPEGKLILGVNNRYALKAFCGDPAGMDSRDESMAGAGRFGREELITIINAAASDISYKFYYPVPDMRMPQMIFTDDYQNGINARERMNDYNYHDGEMRIMEHRLYGDVIDGGALPFMADSYIIEITRDGRLSDIDYAVVTTDRGKALGMATTIRHCGKVIKRALWDEGEAQLDKLNAYTTDLKQKGIPIVETKVYEDTSGKYLEMPYIDRPGLSHVLEDMIKSNRDRFLQIFDAIYGYIIRSSDPGRVYLDLAPCNTFYLGDGEKTEDSILFYDQEFVSDDATPEYAMYRTIRYFFESSPAARVAMNASEMYDRYDITEEMQAAYAKRECTFINEVRNMEEYQWLIKASTPRIAGKTPENVPKKPYHIGYVPGVFDLFHKGHLRLFERCKERCDILIVGVLTDELVEYYKGKKPVISLEDRMEVIRGLRVVDKVIPVDFSNTDKLDAWKQLHYDCHFSGDDHVGHWNDILQELRKRGSNMEFFSYTQGISSTEIRNGIHSGTTEED